MKSHPHRARSWFAAVAIGFATWLTVLNAAAQIRLPAIDPSGNRIFAPGETTTLLGPFHSRNTNASGGGLFGHHRSNPPTGLPSAPSSRPLADWLHQTGSGLDHVTPAYRHPAPVPSCSGDGCRQSLQHLIPKPSLPPKPGQAGQILLTPSRIIAPVGSEVVVLAGLCGGDGHFVINQPIEWMLSNDSVGQIIEVGGMEHPNFNRLVPPTSQKFDGQYAWGRTGLKEKTVTRGTPTPVDDIDLFKGQTYISVSSASPGTSYITCVAPKATGWDKRRATTVIHWVDGLWSIPLPLKTTSGTVQPLTTSITRVGDGSGIPGWKVRYTIIDGAPAEFVPTGSQEAEVQSNSTGQATVQVRQQAGKLEPGQTAIRVDVIRPPVAGEAELVVESGVTSITWSSPALTITAKGPESAPLNQAFNYRLEVTNPGDQVSRGVVVRTSDFSEDIKFISSNPKPAEYGKTLQWDLGDIAPGEPPRFIDIQLSGDSRGVKRLCFQVESQTDRLATEACAETEIAAPCLGVQITGDTQGVVGRQARYDIEIVNQCNEPLENVNLNIVAESGLTVAQQGSRIDFQAGRLEFGEKRSVPVFFELTQPGVHCFVLTVTADGGHTAVAKRCIEIQQAAVGSATLTVDGNRLVQLNDEVVVTARVTNNGNTPLRNVVMLNRFSPSLSPLGFLGLPPENQTRIGNDLAFRIDELFPGESVLVEVHYTARDLDGDAFSQFSITQPVQLEDRLPIRIGNAGNPPTPPDNNSGGLIGNNGGGVAIPSDPSGGLEIRMDPPANSIPANGQTTARIAFAITNTRSTSLQNVNVMLLVPNGLVLTALPSDLNDLPYSGANDERTQHYFQARRELRAGETLRFSADVVGTGPGTMAFQVLAKSDDTLGTASQQVPVTVTPLGQ